MSTRAPPALLARLHEGGIIDDAHLEELTRHTPPPWWLGVLQGVAAWVASMIIMSTFFAPLLMFGEGPTGRALAGIVLAGVALYLFRRRSPFTDQMALAFSLAAQALLVSAVAERIDTLAHGARMIWVAGIAIAAVMMLPTSTVLHRSFCALIAFAFAAFLVGTGNGLALYAVAVAAFAVAAWLTRNHWAASPHAAAIKALANAATLAALGSAWFVSVEQTRGLLLSLHTTMHAGYLTSLYALGASLLLLATILWLSRGAAFGVRVMVGLGALASIAAAWQAPALIVSVTIAIAAFHACHRPWVMVALLAALLYLGEFYYSLQSTLLIKSITLAATGLVLLGLRLIVRAWQRGAA